MLFDEQTSLSFAWTLCDTRETYGRCASVECSTEKNSVCESFTKISFGVAVAVESELDLFENFHRRPVTCIHACHFRYLPPKRKIIMNPSEYPVARYYGHSIAESIWMRMNRLNGERLVIYGRAKWTKAPRQNDKIECRWRWSVEKLFSSSTGTKCKSFKSSVYYNFASMISHRRRRRLRGNGNVRPETSEKGSGLGHKFSVRNEKLCRR